ncbi:MAG: 16S rRNA methyltransferase [Treponema sp.]|jgi:16S rRNA (cytosine1407-C5)-methyltransferase|nr:16S rRNA methyltransferase [Treponema sp.]
MNESFEDYYRRHYGERWEGLRKSLLEEKPAFPFAAGLKEPYLLNYASVLAARSLMSGACAAPAKKEILDACAAPGGKTLVIASLLSPGFRLVANDLSAERRRRLSRVLDKHLPPEKRALVSVSGFDAAALGGRESERNRFAAVLLDAPCSSEAHVIKDPASLAAWTPARPRFLARRQWALLSSAFLLLAPGGSLVYATCALSPEENDGVAGRLPEKYGAEVIAGSPGFEEGEKTLYGRIMLPDREGGLGPLYVARFRKSP